MTGLAAPSAPARAGRPPRRVAIGALALLVVVAGFGGRLWWRAEHYVETDNAQVAGRVHPVSARLAGVVARVAVEDNAPVRAGDVLVELDPADQEVAIERLDAQLAQVEAQRAQAGATQGQADAALEQARAQRDAAEAQVAQARAAASRADAEAGRMRALHGATPRAASQQELDAAIAQRDATSADLDARRAAVRAAASQVDAARAARDAQRAQQEALAAQKDALAAQRREAELQMNYTRLVAPVDGRIGRRTVEVGQRVQPGQGLLAVVEPGVWVVANFKETQLERLRPGMPVEVRLDAFPSTPVRARIDSFAPASGATFALLPPDNATGNFTRVVQRVPVKLAIDTAALAPELSGRLVPGMSATVDVDLRAGGATPAAVSAAPSPATAAR